MMKLAALCSFGMAAGLTVDGTEESTTVRKSNAGTRGTWLQASKRPTEYRANAKRMVVDSTGMVADDTELVLDDDAKTVGSSAIQFKTGYEDQKKMLLQQKKNGTILSEASCSLIENPPSGTTCPNATWIDHMVAADISPEKVFLSIGCNKGNDAVAWLERYDMSEDRFWQTRKWIEEIRKESEQDFVCGADEPTVTAYAHMKKYGIALMAGQRNKKPHAVCVEPVLSNIQLLQKVHTALGYSQESFTIIRAAATASADGNSTADFPTSISSGNETAGLQDPASLLEDPVRLVTVDALVRDNALGHVDVLSIDTEGADADVLKGAASTLASVRYLEFEVHRDLARTSWSRTTLHSVVNDLDAKNFDCFWAGNNGKLVSVLGCWREEFERGEWSNVVCAKRGDVWHEVLQRFGHG